MATGLYHITHLKNLRPIIRSGALLPVSALRRTSAQFTTIAYQDIQDKRSVTLVPCGLGGMLHDYVPFYFAPRSPMLCAISYGRVPSCQNQAAVVHLVSTAQAIDDYGLDFAFTDGHAIMAFTEFYDDLDDLQEMDWKVMKAKYWSDTLEDMDRKRRRQAEFLVHGPVPWSLVTEIAVMDRSVEKKVKSLLEREGVATAVRTVRAWYY